MPPLFFPRRFSLLALPPWNPPSLTVESLLSFPCSRFVPFLSRQGAALTHLVSLSPYDLVICTDGSVPLSFGVGGSGILANCSLCGTEATLSFSAGNFHQYAQVFPLKPAPFCKLFANLGGTNKTAAFLLSDSCSVLNTLSSPPSFLLPQSLWKEASSLSYCAIKLQWVPGHSFLPGNDAVNELARRGALLVLSGVLCSLFLLISCIYISFLGLKAYCLIKIFRQTNYLGFH